MSVAGCVYGVFYYHESRLRFSLSMVAGTVHSSRPGVEDVRNKETTSVDCEGVRIDISRYVKKIARFTLELVRKVRGVEPN